MNNKDKQEQIKNSFFYMLPMLINTLMPFITLPIFTRILTKEDYGVLALSQVYATFAAGLVNFGMVASYDRNYFKYRNDKQKSAQLLYTTLLFVTCNFLFLLVLTYLFRVPLSNLIFHSPLYVRIMLCAFCASSVTRLHQYYLAYFKNSEKAKHYVAYTIAYILISFVLSLYMIAFLRIGVIGLVYAQLFSSIIMFFILSYKSLTLLPLSFSKKLLLESLKISYPLTPRIFFGVIGSQFDKYMIGLLASLGGVGIYSIGQRISYFVFNYMTSLEHVFIPQTYKKMFDLKEKGGESVGRYLTPFAYVSIAIALIIALFSEEIISVLTPSSYHSAINIVIILSMYYGFLFFGKLTGNQLIFTKKTHIASLLTMVAIGLNILLNIPFIIKWGAIGAAWATFIAGLISGSIFFVVAQHYYEIKWEYKKIAAIFLVFFGSSLLMIILRNFSVEYSIRLMVKLTSLLCYAYVGLRIRLLTKENYNLVKNIISFKKKTS
ncbi:oligosaccharide flippase family protein [bacterium]|nr:oligosaccharide flippase family protein [bacterium]